MASVSSIRRALPPTATRASNDIRKTPRHARSHAVRGSAAAGPARSPRPTSICLTARGGLFIEQQLVLLGGAIFLSSRSSSSTSRRARPRAIREAGPLSTAATLTAAPFANRNAIFTGASGRTTTAVGAQRETHRLVGLVEAATSGSDRFPSETDSGSRTRPTLKGYAVGCAGCYTASAIELWR